MKETSECFGEANSPPCTTARRGGCAINKVLRSHHSWAQTGWFPFAVDRKTTPASRSAEASRHFLDRSATPPCGDARRGIIGSLLFSTQAEQPADWSCIQRDVSADTTVAVLIHHLGFWSLNACRVVYVIREERRFGFAYGTLQEHAESGEERFSIEWSDDDSVWYDILAFSRPRQWPAKVARPLSRMLQKKFARDSQSVMVDAIQ